MSLLYSASLPSSSLALSLSLLSPTHGLISVCLICMMLVVVVYRGWGGFCCVVTLLAVLEFYLGNEGSQLSIIVIHQHRLTGSVATNFHFIPCFTCRFFQHRDRYFGTRVSVFDLNLTTHTEILVRA